MRYYETIHTFEVGGGQEIVDGKSYYPGLLRLRMSRHAALRLIESLAIQLQSPEETELAYDFSGLLTENED